MESQPQVATIPGTAEHAASQLTGQGLSCPHFPKYRPDKVQNPRYPSRIGFFHADSPEISCLDTTKLCMKCCDAAIPNGFNFWSLFSKLTHNNKGLAPSKGWLDTRPSTKTAESVDCYPPFVQCGSKECPEASIESPTAGIPLPPGQPEAKPAWEWLQEQQKPFYIDQLHLNKSWRPSDERAAISDSLLAEINGVPFVSVQSSNSKKSSSSGKDSGGVSAGKKAITEENNPLTISSIDSLPPAAAELATEEMYLQDWCYYDSFLLDGQMKLPARNEYIGVTQTSKSQSKLEQLLNKLSLSDNKANLSGSGFRRTSTILPILREAENGGFHHPFAPLQRVNSTLDRSTPKAATKTRNTRIKKSEKHEKDKDAKAWTKEAKFDSTKALYGTAAAGIKGSASSRGQDGNGSKTERKKSNHDASTSTTFPTLPIPQSAQQIKKSPDIPNKDHPHSNNLKHGHSPDSNSSPNFSLLQHASPSDNPYAYTAIYPGASHTTLSGYSLPDPFSEGFIPSSFAIVPAEPAFESGLSLSESPSIFSSRVSPIPIDDGSSEFSGPELGEPGDNGSEYGQFDINEEENSEGGDNELSASEPPDYDSSDSHSEINSGLEENDLEQEDDDLEQQNREMVDDSSMDGSVAADDSMDDSYAEGDMVDDGLVGDDTVDDSSGDNNDDGHEDDDLSDDENGDDNSADDEDGDDNSADDEDGDDNSADDEDGDDEDRNDDSTSEENSNDDSSDDDSADDGNGDDDLAGDDDLDDDSADDENGDDDN